MTMETPLGQARGLGSAQAGAHHQRLERLTAIATLMLHRTTPAAIWRSSDSAACSASASEAATADRDPTAGRLAQLVGRVEQRHPPRVEQPVRDRPAAAEQEGAAIREAAVRVRRGGRSIDPLHLTRARHRALPPLTNGAVAPRFECMIGRGATLRLMHMCSGGSLPLP